MNTKALKFKAVHFAVDAYLGEDDNGISILDRVVGALKRARARDIPFEHAKREAAREVLKMEEFTLLDMDLRLALDTAVILLEH